MAQNELDSDKRVSELFETIEQEIAAIRSNVAESEKADREAVGAARSVAPMRGLAREIDPRRSINMNLDDLRNGRTASVGRTLAQRLAALKPGS